MIRLFTPPDRAAGAAQVSRLLRWAELTLDNELAVDVDFRMAGTALRMAFEYHLHELCRLHCPPKGNRWHSFAIRLLKADVLTMSQYRAARRIARLGEKAVHGKPFDLDRGRRLCEMVSDFLAESEEAEDRELIKTEDSH